VWSIDKDQPIDDIKVMGDYVSQNSSQPRFQTILLGAFSGAALALAAVGIFGVMAYTVSQSTREIGIRMALGAQQSDVLKLVINHGMVLTAIGIVIGLVAAYFLTYLMGSLLYGVSTRDPVTFVLIPLLLAIVSLVASYLPARRASKVDPLIAIRHE
jgi:putative ABC transport system permease protein